MTSALGVDMLLDIFDNDGIAVAELLDSAIASIEVDLQRIESSAATNDYPAILEAAHRLKGTSGSIASTPVAELSLAVERAADERRGSVAMSLLDALRTAIAELRVDITLAKRRLGA